MADFSKTFIDVNGATNYDSSGNLIADAQKTLKDNGQIGFLNKNGNDSADHRIYANGKYYGIKLDTSSSSFYAATGSGGSAATKYSLVIDANGCIAIKSYTKSVFAALTTPTEKVGTNGVTFTGTSGYNQPINNYKYEIGYKIQGFEPYAYCPKVQIKYNTATTNGNPCKMLSLTTSLVSSGTTLKSGDSLITWNTSYSLGSGVTAVDGGVEYSIDTPNGLSNDYSTTLTAGTYVCPIANYTQTPFHGTKVSDTLLNPNDLCGNNSTNPTWANLTKSASTPTVKLTAKAYYHESNAAKYAIYSTPDVTCQSSNSFSISAGYVPYYSGKISAENLQIIKGIIKDVNNQSGTYYSSYLYADTSKNLYIYHNGSSIKLGIVGANIGTGASNPGTSINLTGYTDNDAWICLIVTHSRYNNDNRKLCANKYKLTATNSVGDMGAAVNVINYLKNPSEVKTDETGLKRCSVVNGYGVKYLCDVYASSDNGSALAQKKSLTCTWTSAATEASTEAI